MRFHPAAGVFIDVSVPGWVIEFDLRRHEVCPGTGEEPQALVADPA